MEDIQHAGQMPARKQPERLEDTRLVVDTIPTLAWSARPDGCVFNQRWLEYTGLSLEQALDRGWEAATHPADLSHILEVFHEAVNLGQPFEVEGRFRRFDGEFRWFLFRGNPLLDASGNAVKWFGANTDLQDRKRAEDALRSSEQDFRLMIDRLPGLIAAMDAAGQVEFVSRPVSDFFGRIAEQLKDWGSLVHPDDREHVIAMRRRSIETGVPYETVHRQRGMHGYRWFNVRGHPYRDANGRILGSVANRREAALVG